MTGIEIKELSVAVVIMLENQGAAKKKKIDTRKGKGKSHFSATGIRTGYKPYASASVKGKISYEGY